MKTSVIIILSTIFMGLFQSFPKERTVSIYSNSKYSGFKVLVDSEEVFLLPESTLTNRRFKTRSNKIKLTMIHNTDTCHVNLDLSSCKDKLVINTCF